jgi:HK97 gp10 family phage protein
MSDGVTTTGLEELRRAVEELPEAIQNALKDVARETAERIATRARQLVHVRSGRTRDSIRVVEDAARHQYRVDVGPHEGMPADKDWPANVPLWLEYGTRFRSAHPFMRPALDAEDARYRHDCDVASAAIAEKVLR